MTHWTLGRDPGRQFAALLRLESTLREWRRELFTGPSPGAYYPVQFRVSGTVNNISDSSYTIVIPDQCVPVAVTSYLASGSCDLNLQYWDGSQWNDLLASDMTAGQAAAVDNLPGDFTTGKLLTSSPGTLLLRLEISNASSAANLSVTAAFRDITNFGLA